MSSKETIDQREVIALVRYGFITKLQELVNQGTPILRALEKVASAPLVDRDGREARCARRTLEDWWYAYKHGGFRALYPKKRRDKGRCRVLSAQEQKWIVQQVRSFPDIPVKVLYRRWLTQGHRLPSLNVLYRVLEAKELSQRARNQQRRQPPISGPTKAFEAPYPNDLWMVDFSTGVFLKGPGERKAKLTHLCLILDDHSRLIPYAAYYWAADTRAFHQTLKEAVLRRGLPQKLYTDQGGPFVSHHSKVICANLGIRLLHAKPYAAWSKGKVERVFLTLQRDFQCSLKLPGQNATCLEDLNAKLSQWLASDYHSRIHSATGQSPNDRFRAHSHLIRHLDPHLDIDKLFYTQIKRLVRKDATVRLEGSLWEVDLSLRGLRVHLHFDPFSKNRVEVYYRDSFFGLAKKLDVHLNSQIQGGIHYERIR